MNKNFSILSVGIVITIKLLFLFLILISIYAFFILDNFAYPTITLNFADGTTESRKVSRNLNLTKELSEGTNWYYKSEDGFKNVEEILMDNSYEIYELYNVHANFINDNQTYTFPVEELNISNVKKYALLNLELDNFYKEEEFSNFTLNKNYNYYLITAEKEKKSETQGSILEQPSSGKDTNIDINDDDGTSNSNSNNSNNSADNGLNESIYFSDSASFSEDEDFYFEFSDIPGSYDLGLKKGYISSSINNKPASYSNVISLIEGDYTLYFIYNTKINLSGNFNTNYEGEVINNSVSLTGKNNFVSLKVLLLKNESKIIETKIDCKVEASLSGDLKYSDSMEGYIFHKLYFYNKDGNLILQVVKNLYPKRINGEINYSTNINSELTSINKTAADITKIFNKENISGYFISDSYKKTATQSISASLSKTFKINSFNFSYTE